MARPKVPARTVTGSKPSKPVSWHDKHLKSARIQPVVFYASIAGATETYAKIFCADLSENVATAVAQSHDTILAPKLFDLAEIELDDYFTTEPKSSANIAYFYIVLVPTYNIDTNLTTFLSHLQETHYDFRVDTAPLVNLSGYAVLGFGDREGWPTEEEGFCAQAREADRWMAKLTRRKRAYPLGTVDVKGTDADQRITEWRRGVVEVLQSLAQGNGLGEGVEGSGDAVESEDEDEAVAPPAQTTRPARRPKARKSSTLDDLENLGSSFRGSSSKSTTTKSKSSTPVDFTTTPSANAMVPSTSPTHASLTKQGYTIVGTHSGVKICRWTKSALRGRGSCYKHSFYHIASHNCMEATPSLSCSNKCVFCWRHGTNPVSTTWRWAVDDPLMIFEGMKKGHIDKIRMMRGVPGVRAERFEEALRIRHCALSLVGEPIFYPRINELLALLHGERISSFLVCNAQHPDQLASLAPVTQLYVSIDAADATTLRKIDRPLHRDYWSRFLRCLDIVKEKRWRQRTVYRLTLVKGFNVEAEAQGYADLVARGLPGFVEIKGVTYCGTSTSKSAGLTMQNVPFYEEVVQFVEALERACKERGLDYGIAAEHAHSCCILMADRRFWKEGTWWTGIDYERFFALLESGEGVDGMEGVRPEEYMARTPEWALWGNGGFDPRDERVKKKGKKAKLEERKEMDGVREEGAVAAKPEEQSW
ncbi:MAG: hypothetical protein Q9162_001435 [Coniocarpon cinnabarinum]